MIPGKISSDRVHVDDIDPLVASHSMLPASASVEEGRAKLSAWLAAMEEDNSAIVLEAVQHTCLLLGCACQASYNLTPILDAGVHHSLVPLLSKEKQSPKIVVEVLKSLSEIAGGVSSFVLFLMFSRPTHHTHHTHHTPYTIHHTPYTIHHTPYTIHHTPYTIHHTPYTPYTIHHTHHTPYTIHTIHHTLHTPYTIHTIHHTPYTPYSMHHTPYTTHIHASTHPHIHTSTPPRPHTPPPPPTPTKGTDAARAKAVTDTGCVAVVVSLLGSPVLEVSAEAMRLLIQLAGDGLTQSRRDPIVEAGALPVLARVLEREAKADPLFPLILDHLTALIPRLVRGPPHYPFSQTSPILSVVTKLLPFVTNELLLRSLIFILKFFTSSGTHEIFDAVIKSGIVNRCVGVLSHPCVDLVVSALHAMAGMVTGTDAHRYAVVRSGVLRQFPDLFTRDHAVVSELCYTVKHLSVGTTKYWNALVTANIIPALIAAMDHTETLSRKEAVDTVVAILLEEQPRQITALVKNGAVKGLVKASQTFGIDSKSACRALEGLVYVYKSGLEQSLKGRTKNPYIYAFMDTGVTEVLNTFVQDSSVEDTQAVALGLMKLIGNTGAAEKPAAKKRETPIDRLQLAKILREGTRDLSRHRTGAGGRGVSGVSAGAGGKRSGKAKASGKGSAAEPLLPPPAPMKNSTDNGGMLLTLICTFDDATTATRKAWEAVMSDEVDLKALAEALADPTCEVNRRAAKEVTGAPSDTSLHQYTVTNRQWRATMLILASPRMVVDEEEVYMKRYRG